MAKAPVCGMEVDEKKAAARSKHRVRPTISVPQREKVAYSPPSSSGSSANGPTSGLVQSSTGGSVTIDVEWIKAEGGFLIFNVAMNTNSVDLEPGKSQVYRGSDSRCSRR